MLKTRGVITSIKKLVAVMLIMSCAITLGAREYFSDILANDIPINARAAGNSGICSLYIVVEGGNAFYKDGELNLESVVLEMLGRGSKKYPYAKLKQLEYDAISMIGGGAGYDYSTFGYSCLKEDMFDMLDALQDAFIDPLFDEGEFKVVSSTILQNLMQAQANPNTRLYNGIRREVFKGHAYSRDKVLRLENIKELTLPKVAACHKKMLDSKRIRVVIAGDIKAGDFKKIKGALDKRLGKLPGSSGAKPLVLPVDFSAVPPSTTEVVKTAGDSGYIAGVFPCPSRGDGDYIAYGLACNMVDDLLNNIVREKHGAIYSGGTSIMGGKVLIGMIWLYKAKEDTALPQYVQEALNSFPTGEEFKSLVEAQKNIYINTLFSNSVTADGLCGQLITAIEYLGGARAYDTRMDKIRAVTAGEVESAFRKYFTLDNMKWFTICDEAHKESFGY